MNALSGTNPGLVKHELTIRCMRIPVAVKGLSAIVLLLVSSMAFSQSIPIVSVDSFTLIDADTDQPVATLVNGMVINQADWTNRKFSVRANASGASIDRVDFMLEGPINHRQTERIDPYALFGDAPQGNYAGRELLPGDYILTATAASLITRGTGQRITFKVIPAAPSSSTLFLFNARTDRKIRELKGGDVVRLNETGKFLDVAAEFTFGNISKVEFDLSGPITHHQVELVPPYALFGDINGNFNGRYLKPGQYTLKVESYVGGIKWSSRTIAFTVIDAHARTESVAKAVQFSVYPNPTSSYLNIVNDGDVEMLDLSITDQNGNILLRSGHEKRSDERIDVSNLGKGVHYLRAKTAERTYTIRFVIE